NLSLSLFSALVRRLRVFDFLFVVYPGSKKEVQAYVPLFLQWMIPLISGIGIVRSGRERGLVVGISRDIEELKANGSLKDAYGRIHRLGENLGIKFIALAGRLPSVFHREGFSLGPPFVTGDKGTVFAVKESLLSVIENEGLSPAEINMGVVGVGFVGSGVIKGLKGMGFKSLTGVDNESRRLQAAEGMGVELSQDPRALSGCELVVFLTPRGSDAEAYLSHLKKGVVVLDDTHPYLPRKFVRYIQETKKGRAYRVMMSLSGMSFLPSFPGYASEWLPGCVIEAVVATRHGNCLAEQEDFDGRAKSMGFEPATAPLKEDPKAPFSA
ncbi:MAG: hypothetical protein HZC13_03885, partial [Nitrospirae bacterium]|nr:hypothetical protein [Nitrospirota bacterium]